jgi:hypothetical protein
MVRGAARRLLRQVVEALLLPALDAGGNPQRAAAALVVEVARPQLLGLTLSKVRP